jgi:hypothetical protein
VQILTHFPQKKEKWGGEWLAQFSYNDNKNKNAELA